uniref:Uncharacterized protein n=1 Tax=Rhizophora mucronata TaxID=61149 RepID=A0A2P2PS89_RHIMU
MWNSRWKGVKILGHK